jgi:hypothetical protein
MYVMLCIFPCLWILSQLVEFVGYSDEFVHRVIEMSII